MKPFILIYTVILVLIIGCKPDNDAQPSDVEDLNLGGETSIAGSYIQIFQQPAANLTGAELDLHRAADRAFGDIFVTAPSTINGGLGPVFNQNSCESCHTSNGRSPFPDDPSNLRGLLMRLSMAGEGANGEPLPVPSFGGQLQTKALFGIEPEAKLTWQELEEIVQYLDGEPVVLTKPVFSLEAPYTTWPDGALISPRIAPPVIGLGLLEAIEGQDILSKQDPDDADGDGISGKPNWVWDEAKQTKSLGRFGWKAGQPNLRQQTAGAYNQDMGITNPVFPMENCIGQTQLDALTDDPEIDEATLDAATFYTQSLAVPQRRNTSDDQVIKGRELFVQLNCSGCHRPKFVTGNHPEYAFLSQQTIFPYSDLLLHDMGDGLADNRPDFAANGREWRTTPLWGLGLTKVVGGPTANFLHDGRAKTLEEAILWHGGEAEKSREAFQGLGKDEREAVIRFLESL